MRVAVIGAGPAGLSSAYQLVKAGQEVDVFEAGGDVGGMSRSLPLWGQTVDLGPHRFFSSDPRVNKLWLEIVEGDYRMVDRLTRIYYQGRFFDYPLSPGNALRNLGLGEATHCVSSYLKEQVRPKPQSAPDTFEEWVTRRFGRRLYEIFFKAYSEKLWGIPCRELDSDFAAQRIKKLSLLEAIKNAVKPGAARHRTLLDRFAYPMGGTGMVYERMAEYVNALGRIHLNRPIRRVLHKAGRVTGVELQDGRTFECDHVISSMPLTLLVRGLGDLPEPVSQAVDSLTFRNTILVYLHVQAKDLFPDQWVYIHAPELLMGRVTNFRNWVPELYGAADSTILAVEFWCYDEDEIWQEGDAGLAARAEREIRSTGLIGDARVADGHVIRIRRSYPVYARGYKQHLGVITDYLRQFSGLIPIGRYGAFKYNNQDHSLLMGILAAENVLEEEQNDLWSVNTDYESYQESARITEAGLEFAEAG